jgi:hypothetical protein
MSPEFVLLFLCALRAFARSSSPSSLSYAALVIQARFAFIDDVAILRRAERGLRFKSGGRFRRE